MFNANHNILITVHKLQTLNICPGGGNINKVFKALSDETRRSILKLLSERDMTAGSIADCFNMTKPSISKHLDILKEAELISAFRQGQFIIYSINTTVLQDALSGFLDLVGTNQKKGRCKNGDDKKDKN
jgi:DNA-binding transcriptional ArsR family regulator